MISVIGLWIAAGLLGIAILAIVFSGVRGIVNGNLDLKKIGVMLLPVIIWIVVLLITASWIKAGLLTMLIMLALMIIAIFLTGARGVFT